MVRKSRNFDPARYLKTETARALYMNEALETNDIVFIADALGVIARSRGMTKIAKEADLSRESLYKSLSKKGNPEFATILKLMAVLGLKLCVESKTVTEKKTPTKTPAKPATKRQKEMATATA